MINYRPISFLTCFSKIFEIFGKTKIITQSQYRFLSNLFTLHYVILNSHATLHIVTIAYEQLNINQFTSLGFWIIKKLLILYVMKYCCKNLVIMVSEVFQATLLLRIYLKEYNMFPPRLKTVR